MFIRTNYHKFIRDRHVQVFDGTVYLPSVSDYKDNLVF